MDAFLVTKREGNPEYVGTCPVYQADTYVKDKKVFVVIAIMSDQVDEIKTYLDLLNRNNYIQYAKFM